MFVSPPHHPTRLIFSDATSLVVSIAAEKMYPRNLHEPSAPRSAMTQLIGHPRIRFGFGSAAARRTIRNPELVSQKQMPSAYKNAKAKQSNVNVRLASRVPKSKPNHVSANSLPNCNFHMYASVVTLAPCLCLLVNCLGVAMASPILLTGQTSKRYIGFAETQRNGSNTQ